MTSQKTIVLITGSNSGIGFDTAALLASQPDYHIILTSRSTKRGEAALSQLQARNPKGSISLLPLDVTDPSTVSAAASSVTEQFGRLDVLINNAGLVSYDPDMQAQMRATFDANSTGAALVSYAFVPLLQKSSNPRVIYISSGLGSINQRADANSPYYAVPALAYRMSKAALDMLAVHTHAEFKEWGCKVWALCPGFVITNLEGEGNQEKMRQMGAISSETSAEFIQQVVRGDRDADVGKFVHRDGVYSW